jgi:hypothetical protein
MALVPVGRCNKSLMMGGDGEGDATVMNGGKQAEAAAARRGPSHCSGPLSISQSVRLSIRVEEAVTTKMS